MFGVIIWSDPEASSAVIWCEEKRSLAYYDGQMPEHSPPKGGFDAGDFVEFDLVDCDRRWMAINARTIVLPPPTRGVHARRLQVIEVQETAEPGAEIIKLDAHRRTADGASGPRFNRRG